MPGEIILTEVKKVAADHKNGNLFAKGKMVYNLFVITNKYPLSLLSHVKTIIYMKKLLFGLAGILLLASCGNQPKDHEAKTDSAQTEATATGDALTVDTSSTVGWHVAHKGGVDPHTGFIKVKDGSVSVENGKITGGSFTFDINTLTDIDLTDTAKKAKLEGHLKSADFFDVAKYPTAKFAITGTAPYDSTKVKSLLPGATDLISGNLTFKDSTLNVTFPAIVAIGENSVKVDAKFSIDRTTWGLNYKGPNNAQDWIIEKNVELTLNIKAIAK